MKLGGGGTSSGGGDFGKSGLQGAGFRAAPSLVAGGRGGLGARLLLAALLLARLAMHSGSSVCEWKSGSTRPTPGDKRTLASKGTLFTSFCVRDPEDGDGGGKRARLTGEALAAVKLQVCG